MARADGLALVVLVALAADTRARPPVTPPPRPASLAGSHADGEVRAARGRLRVDEDLRRFFDHHLSGGGEESDAAARARLEAELDARLDPASAAQARALLERYLAMREAASTLEPGGDLDARWERVRRLRRDFLGAENAAALYASDDADVDAALARRRGQAVLTPAEEASLAPLALQLREASLPAGEIQAARERAFGPDGAARLAELDRQREAWRARLEGFRERRAGIEDPAELEHLLEELFTPEETLRVRALERLP